MNEVTFKKLEWLDIDRFIKLRKLQLTEEGSVGSSEIDAQLLDYFKKHMDDNTFISWVAVTDNEIIATSGISFYEKPPYFSNPTGLIGLLSCMYTIPEYRRRGIAKKLMELVINDAKEYGCKVFQLTASDAGAGLYESFGFERFNNFFSYRVK